MRCRRRANKNKNKNKNKTPVVRVHPYDLGDREFATLEKGMVKIIAYNRRTQAQETVTLALDTPPDAACLRACLTLSEQGVHGDLASIITLAVSGHYVTTNPRLNFANPLFVKDVHRACDYIAATAPASAFAHFQFLVVYDMGISAEDGGGTTRADALVLVPTNAPCTTTSSEDACPAGTPLARVALCRTHVLWTYRAFLERTVAQLRRAAAPRPPPPPPATKLKPNDPCPCTSGQKFKRCCGRRF
jgi:hypothetical protein